MSIIRGLITITLLFLPFVTLAEIYSATTVAEINNSLMEMLEKRNPERALVLMPLEGFLAEPSHPAFHAHDEESSILVNRILEKVKLSTGPYLEELMLTEYENEFSDPMIPEFIKNIQTKNVPLMVITRNVTGSFNKIPYLEVWTWKYLVDHGVDISKSPIGSRQIILNKQYKKVKGTYPTFFKGLLSCNSNDNINSPQSLIAYLLAVELKWIPDIVYVIDKDEGYIKSLEQQFKTMSPDVQVEGFVYSPKRKSDRQIDSKDFIAFWENFVKKLNSVSRKEPGGMSEEPYEQ